jgi:glycosyltransferase involved in cell wall biosynthesis
MPLLSILVASKNQAHFLKDLITALKAQSFQDFEVIVVDSNSVDESPQIFLQYKKIKLIQRECDANTAYEVALGVALGKYIMIATTSDFLYSYRWIESAIYRLESDDELSCVWGSGLIVNEDGSVKSLWAEHYLISAPPAKNNYLYYWLYEPYLPELNYVVSTDVFKYCLKFFEVNQSSFNINNRFLYNFTKCGFLQAYIPEIANAGRVHKNSLTEFNQIKDRIQSFIFFKLRLIFIFNIFIKKNEFKFKNRKFEYLIHYKLEKFPFFLVKLITLIIKNSLRKLLKKLLIILFKI